MNTIFTLAKLTFQEAIRRRIAAAALVLGLLFLIVFGIGVRTITSSMADEGFVSDVQIQAATHFLFIAGLYVVNFLMIMMSVLTSVDTLSGEITSGTMHTIAAKPTPRSRIVLGKWLGFAGMLTLYFIFMAGGVWLLVRVLTGYSAPHILDGFVLILLNSFLLLGLSLVGGTRLSTLANGTLLFGLYGVAFVGGWVEQIGSLFDNTNAVNIGIVSSLILPSESLWRRAVYEMQSPLETLVGFSPFSAGNVIPSPLMVWYALFYAAIAVLIAVRAFAQRDL